MSTYTNISDETQKVFNRVLSETGIPKFVTFKLLGNHKQKTVGKISKANDIVTHLTDIDIIIILNDVIFDGLEEKYQEMLLEELLAQVYFDIDKDNLKLIKPDISTFSLLLTKYGIDFYMSVREVVSSLYNKLDSEEE